MKEKQKEELIKYKKIELVNMIRDLIKTEKVDGSFRRRWEKEIMRFRKVELVNMVRNLIKTGKLFF